jgi:hypothetical protein
LVFAQLLDFVPYSHFEHLVDRYAANHGIRHFSAWSQLLCMINRVRQIRWVSA